MEKGPTNWWSICTIVQCHFEDDYCNFGFCQSIFDQWGCSNGCSISWSWHLIGTLTENKDEVNFRMQFWVVPSYRVPKTKQNLFKKPIFYNLFQITIGNFVGCSICTFNITHNIRDHVHQGSSLQKEKHSKSEPQAKSSSRSWKFEVKESENQNWNSEILRSTTTLLSKCWYAPTEQYEL